MVEKSYELEQISVNHPVEPAAAPMPIMKPFGNTMLMRSGRVFIRQKIAAKSAYGAASSLASKVGGDLASDASSLSSRMESASKSAAGEQSHKCADEHGSCACTGTVKFGAGSKWSPPKRVSGSIQCSDTVFGDPDPGVRKTCVCGP